MILAFNTFYSVFGDKMIAPSLFLYVIELYFVPAGLPDTLFFNRPSGVVTSIAVGHISPGIIIFCPNTSLGCEANNKPSPVHYG